MTMSPRDHLSDRDLLRLIDREPGALRAASMHAHVRDCPSCAARREAIVRTMADADAALRADPAPGSATHADLRTALEARLAAEGAAPTRPHRFHLSARWVGQCSTAAAAILALLLVAHAQRPARAPASGPRASSQVEPDALPIAALTPGAAADISAEQLCRGDRRRPEPADPTVRARILSDYGMAHVPAHEYELDYLITPELGGANDARNLWPERYGDRTWNAKVKDQLEDLLPALVCEGKVDLQTAQRDIAVDWVAAYKKYFQTDVPLRPGA
jgi:hypothetical protein